MTLKPPTGFSREFVSDADMILEQMAVHLANLSDSSSQDTGGYLTINAVFREAHSLKGLASIFGHRDVHDLAHAMENILESLRLGKISLQKDILSLLTESQEFLQAIVHGTASNNKTTLNSCIYRINASLEQSPLGSSRQQVLSPPNSVGLSEQMLTAMTTYEKHRLNENLAAGHHLFLMNISIQIECCSQDLAIISDRISHKGELISILPNIDPGREGHIGFDLLVGSLEPLDTLSDHLQLPVDACVIRLSLVPTRAVVNNNMVQTIHPSGATGDLPKHRGSLIRVDTQKLDELVDCIDRCAGLRADFEQMLAATIPPALYAHLQTLTGEIEDVCALLRHRTIAIRMAPLTRLYDRISRAVRKISREQGRQIRLHLKGGSITCDQVILDEIMDPVVHLIRNAAAHGIESPEQRISQGKPPQGNISVCGIRQGDSVVIVIKDDGSGIDSNRIRAAARTKGFLSPKEKITDKEAMEMIFLPGFSTSDQVNSLSGRGIGMDVVKNNITAIAGSIDVHTRKGRGTTFTITVPVLLPGSRG